MATRRSSLTLHLPIPTSPLLRQTAIGCGPLSPISRLSSVGSNASTDSDETVERTRMHLLTLLQHLRRKEARLTKRLQDAHLGDTEQEATRKKHEHVLVSMRKTLDLLAIL